MHILRSKSEKLLKGEKEMKEDYKLKSNSIDLSFGKNNNRKDRWMITTEVSSDWGECLWLEICHHHGYFDMDDYRENAYTLHIGSEDNEYEIISKVKRQQMYQDILDHEGPLKAKHWMMNQSKCITDETLLHLGEIMKDRWEAMVFTLELFRPTICF